MRRAGWGVWIAYDLPGSYEELPPNLLDELKRDRRWCHGNLMNFRLFLVNKLYHATRFPFPHPAAYPRNTRTWILQPFLGEIVPQALCIF